MSAQRLSNCISRSDAICDHSNGWDIRHLVTSPDPYLHPVPHLTHTILLSLALTLT